MFHVCVCVRVTCVHVFMCARGFKAYRLQRLCLGLYLYCALLRELSELHSKLL